MGNPEDQPSDEEREEAESELGIPLSDESSPLVVTPSSDEELAVVKKTLTESAPMGAANSVFEQYPDEVITILRNSLFHPSENADEIMLLPILTTELDSSSDMLSLHLRARLENPEIQNGERQEALTLLVYTALGSYQGDRLYSSYAFNHLAGAIASGEITHQRLEDEVNELAQKVSYSDEQKEAFLQLVEERVTAYLHDTKAVLKDLSRGSILRRSLADEEKRLDLYKEAEGRDEVLDIASDIVSNPKMLRFARATLVKGIYLDKDTTLSERHRLQERLQTLAEAGSKLMDADPATFLAEHLISYNAGEWDLCAQLVAIRDVMGNRQVAAILRTAAGEELFQDQALKMMVEVAHHNPDNSTIVATLNAMLKSGEVDEGGLLLVAQQVLGGEEVAQRFLSRIQLDSATEGAKSSLPIPDLDKETEILYRFYEKYHRSLISQSFDSLRALNISIDAEQEEKITSRLAYALYKNPLDTDLEEEKTYGNSDIVDYSKDHESFNILVYKKIGPKRQDDIYFGGGRKASRVELGSLKPLIAQAATDQRVIQEISLLLPKGRGERLLALSGLIVSERFNSKSINFHPRPFQVVKSYINRENEKQLEKIFGERELKGSFDLSVAVSDLPPTIIGQLLRLGDPKNVRTALPPKLSVYATEHPLELVPYALMVGDQAWATQLMRTIYPLLAEDSSDEAKEACRAIQEQLIAEAREILGSENVITPERVQEILGLEIDLETTPLIPFSRRELETAKKLDQFLVYRHSENDRGEPVTMSSLKKTLQPVFTRDGDGKVIEDSLYCGTTNQYYFAGDTFDSGWALTTRETIPGSIGKDYLDRTDQLASYVSEILKDIAEPALRTKYTDAIDEFATKRNKIESLLIFRQWDEATKQLAGLKLHKVCLQSAVEAMYDIMMYFKHNRSGDTDEARLLKSSGAWTNSFGGYGRMVYIGDFRSNGLSVGLVYPGGSGGVLGVSFSRNQ